MIKLCKHCQYCGMEDKPHQLRSGRIQFHERFEVVDLILPVLFSFSKHWAWNQAAHQVKTDTAIKWSRVIDQLLVHPPKFGQSAFPGSCLIAHVAARLATDQSVPPVEPKHCRNIVTFRVMTLTWSTPMTKKSNRTSQHPLRNHVWNCHNMLYIQSVLLGAGPLTICIISPQYKCGHIQEKTHTHTPSSTMQICVQGLSQSVYHTKLWITATNKAQALAKMLTKPCNTSRCFASNSTRCHQNQWNGINPPHLHHLVHERHNVMSNRLWTSVWSRQGWNALYPSHCTNPLCTVCNNGLGVTILFSCKVDRASHNWTNSFLHYRDDHTDAKKVLLAVDIIGSPLQWANQQQQAALLQRSFTDSLDK